MSPCATNPPSRSRIAFGASCAALLAAAVTAVAAPAAPAVQETWLPVASGTTQTITSLDYQSDTRAWYGTDGGQLGYADENGLFKVAATFPGHAITEVDFSAWAPTGFAISAQGGLFRSSDGGRTWSDLTGTLPGVRAACAAVPATVQVPRLTALEWTYPSSVVIVGGSASTEPVVLQVVDDLGTLRITNLNLAAAAPWCKLGTTGEALSDLWVRPTTPGQLTFAAADGSLAFTPNGLTQQATALSTLFGGAAGGMKIALDHSRPERLWAVDPSCAASCLLRSTDAGRTATPMAVQGPPQLTAHLRAIDYDINSVVAVGDDGTIVRSTDGVTAAPIPATGALAATDWRALSIKDHSHALVGGAGGALAKMNHFAVMPDVSRPTIAIEGPRQVAVGQPATYTVSVDDGPTGIGVDPAATTWRTVGVTAHGPTTTFSWPFPGMRPVFVEVADRAGNVAEAQLTVTVTGAAPPTGDVRGPSDGSGGRAGSDGRAGGRDGRDRAPANAARPLRRSAGGARVVAWTRIDLRRGRAVPVRLSARSARRFTLAVTTARRPFRTIATTRATVARGGRRLALIRLGRGVRAGPHRLVVRAFDGRRAIGRPLVVRIALLR